MSVSDNEPECFICWSPLTKEHGKKVLIHNYDKQNKNSEKWEHSCHEKCLNTWSKQCITATERRYPKCPICNIFKIPINKIPVSLRAKAKEILDEEENEPVVDNIVIEGVIENVVIEAQDLEEEEIEEVEVAKYRLQCVREWAPSNGPFLAILVCFNGVIINKCSNITFNLTINATFGELKAALLNRNVDFYKSKGMLHSDNLAHNLNPQNWINWTYPSFRLSEIHYGIPPYTSRFEQLDCGYDLNEDDILLSELYLEYQTKVGLVINRDPNLINSELAPNAYKKLEQIYLKENIWRHESTGPDDPGYMERAFKNIENPWFPDSDLYKAGRYGEKITWESLMWLTVHIDNV